MRRLRPPVAIASLVTALLLAAPAHAQCVLSSIEAPGGAGNLGFGSRVAAGGDVFAISSRFAPGVEGDTGAVHVYRRSRQRVTFEQTLTAPPGSGDDRFGFSVDVDGDRIVVGAPQDGDPVRQGAAYVFRYNGSSWELEARLVASDRQPGDELGRAVAIRGEFVLVGAPNEDDGAPGAGAAYIYHRTGGSWEEITKVVASDAREGAAFGSAISVHGDTAVVAALLDDGLADEAGAAYVLRRQGGDWIEVTKLTADDAQAGDWFGSAVSFDGERILVGARNHLDRGAAYLFEKFGGVWAQSAKLMAIDADAGDSFGSACAVSQDRILVTAINDQGVEHGMGATYLFTLHPTDGWVEEAKLSAPNRRTGDRYGGALAISKKIALVGATYEDGRNGRMLVHHLLRPDCRCMSGKVNAGLGSIRNVLFVNGSTGGRDRTVSVPEGELVTLVILEPPSEGNGKFVVHANLGVPERNTITVMPGGMGTACFPMLIEQGAAPAAIWNSIGRTSQIGPNHYFDGSELPPPDRAPAVLLQLSDGDPQNLPAGTVVTFQGAMGDPGSAADREGSVTNAVILRIE